MQAAESTAHSGRAALNDGSIVSNQLPAVGPVEQGAPGIGVAQDVYSDASADHKMGQWQRGVVHGMVRVLYTGGPAAGIAGGNDALGGIVDHGAGAVAQKKEFIL